MFFLFENNVVEMKICYRCWKVYDDVKWEVILKCGNKKFLNEFKFKFNMVINGYVKLYLLLIMNFK